VLTIGSPGFQPGVKRRRQKQSPRRNIRSTGRLMSRGNVVTYKCISDYGSNRWISNKEVRLAKLVNHILHFTNRHSFFDIRYSLSLFNIRYSHRFFLRSRCSLRQNDGIVRGSMGGMRRHQFSSWRVNRSDEWLRNLKTRRSTQCTPCHSEWAAGGSFFCWNESDRMRMKNLLWR